MFYLKLKSKITSFLFFYFFFLYFLFRNLQLYLTENPSTTAEFEKPLKDHLFLLTVLLECKKIFSSFSSNDLKGTKSSKSTSQTSNGSGVKELITYLEQQLKTYNNIHYHSIHQSLLKLFNLVKKFQGTNYRLYSKQQPKIQKLKEILSQHFNDYQKRGESTRVIVFVHLRTTVVEVKNELLSLAGKGGETIQIKPKEFIGQGNSSSASGDGTHIGLTQAEQSQILKQFNSGFYNVLVATSIAEEGIDIAEVDLIVLLDSVASPTRLVQRCGRTGRKRSGRIVIISAPSLASSSTTTSQSSVANSNSSSSSGATQETEEDKFEQSYKSIQMLNEILKRASRTIHLFSQNPRMIPSDCPLPELELKELGRSSTVPFSALPDSPTSGNGKGNKTIANYFSSRSNINNDDNDLEEPVGTDRIGKPLVLSVDNEEEDPFACYFSNDKPPSELKNITVRKSSRKVSHLQTRFSDPCPSEVIDISQSQSQNDWTNDHFNFSNNSGNVNNNSGFDPFGLTHNEYGNSKEMILDQENDLLGSSNFTAKKKLNFSFRQSGENPSSLSLGIQDQSSFLPSEINEEEEEFNVDDDIAMEDDDREEKGQEIDKEQRFVRPSSVEREETEALLPEPSFLLPLDQTPLDQLHSPDRFDSQYSKRFSSQSSNSGNNKTLRLQSRSMKDISWKVLAYSVESFEDFYLRKKEEKNSSKEKNLLPVGPQEIVKSSFLGKSIQSAMIKQLSPFVSQQTDNTSSYGNLPATQHINPHFGEEFSPSLILQARKSTLTAAVATDDIEDAEEWMKDESRTSAERKKKTSLSSSGKKLRFVEKGKSSCNQLKQIIKPDPQQHSQQREGVDCKFCCICFGRENNNHERKKSDRSLLSDDEDDKSCDSEDDDEEPLIQCKGPCGSVFHRSCYEETSDDDEEEEDGMNKSFLCESCSFQKKNKKNNNNSSKSSNSCALCFQSDGLLRNSSDGSQWAHLPCVLFTPELTVDDSNHPNNLSRLDPDRSGLLCRLCLNRGGAVIQCKYEDCCVGFHPFCAMKEFMKNESEERSKINGGQLVVWEKGNCVFRDFYCALHESHLPAKPLIITTLKPILGIQGREDQSEIPKEPRSPFPRESSFTRTQLELTNTDEKKSKTKKEIHHRSAILDPFEIKRSKPESRKKLKKIKETVAEEDEAEQVKDDQEQEETEKEKQKRLKRLRKQKNLYSKRFHNPALAKYFELEADVGEAGSEDEEKDRKKNRYDDDEDDSSSGSSSEQLSGDFINDGTYTQPEDLGETPRGALTQMAMYYDVNRQLHEEENDTQFQDDDGNWRVENLVLRKNHQMYHKNQNINVNSVDNTPFKEGKEVHPKKNEGKQWKTKEKKKSLKDDEDEELFGSEDDEEDWDAYDASFVVEDDEIEYESNPEIAIDEVDEEEDDFDRLQWSNRNTGSSNTVPTKKNKEHKTDLSAEQIKKKQKKDNIPQSSSSAAMISFPRSHSTALHNKSSLYFQETDPSTSNKIVNILDASGEKEPNEEEEEFLMKRRNNSSTQLKNNKNKKLILDDDLEEEDDEVMVIETNKENYSQTPSLPKKKNEPKKRPSLLDLLSSDEKKKDDNKKKKKPSQTPSRQQKKNNDSNRKVITIEID
jgi:ribosomal protein S14